MSLHCEHVGNIVQKPMGP